MMACGGNTKLKNFLMQYELDNQNILDKYKTKATLYYRKKVCQNS